MGKSQGDSTSTLHKIILQVNLFHVLLDQLVYVMEAIQHELWLYIIV